MRFDMSSTKVKTPFSVSNFSLSGTFLCTGSPNMKSPAKYDTCFKSCYLTKNLLENYDELDSFGYWVLTDWIEETQPSKEQFHGGLGLFTQDGIKKPHYYAFDFMNKLGDLLIDKGNGYFITKSYGKIQILLYNYEHFNHLFASGETFDMTFIERYTPFSQLGKMEISLELTDIPVKACIIREHIINQASGSAFDEWVRMGAPNLCKKDIEYLKQVSVPKLFVRKEKVENNILPINVSFFCVAAENKTDLVFCIGSSRFRVRTYMFRQFLV